MAVAPMIGGTRSLNCFLGSNDFSSNELSMKIGLIGDLHAEDEHLATAISFLTEQAVDLMLCTGDIVDGLGCPHRCIELLQAHDILVVAGNHDRWLLQDKARHVANAHHRLDFSADELDYLAGLPRQRKIETPFGNVQLCHGVDNNDLQKIWPGTARMPVERSARLDQIIADEEYSYFINGHMHYRCVIHFEALTLINAGTLRPDHKPGFSILDLAQHTVSGYEFSELPTAVRSIDTRANLQSPHQVFTNTQGFAGDWDPVTLYA